MSKKNKKSILFVVPYGFNDRMSSYVEFVAGRLLAKNGWSVIVLVRSEDEKNNRDQLYGITVYRYTTLWSALLQFLQILYRQRPQIFHFVTLRNNRVGIITSLLAKLTGKKIICTEYGLLHDHYLVDDRDDPLSVPLKKDGLIFSVKQIFAAKNSLKNNVKNYFFHWPLTHADTVLFVTKHNVPLAQQLGLQNITYLPYLLDNCRWEDKKVETNKKVDEEDVRALAAIKKINGPYALFIGQLKLRKGWDVLLKAIPHVNKNLLPYFILITSSQADEPAELTTLLQQDDIRNRVLLFRKISNEVLAQVYKQSSIVVLPSRYEGFGLVAVEAFEQHKPLVASNVPAINEHVRHEQNGLLFPNKNYKKLADELERLSRDDELKNRLIQGGDETLRQFKSETRKKQWLDFYNHSL